jgi:ArsR family transcriptional regulator, cadmium/lead-responsive transcriptional repressor
VSAIADPSRRGALDLLGSNGDVSASWLAGRVPFSRQAVSKHLFVLERAGLISRRKQGREVLYQVQTDRLDQATRAVAELAAQWDRRLGVIKRLAETAHAENKIGVAMTDKSADASGPAAWRRPCRNV